VEPKRLQLRGATLLELRDRVAREHGEDAIIIAADRVTVGGIRGFFARQYYEVTVELPPARRRAAHALDVPARLGIAALLDDADEVEAHLQHSEPEQQLSTQSAGFAALMDELTYATARAETPESTDGDPTFTTGQGAESDENAAGAENVAGATNNPVFGDTHPDARVDLRIGSGHPAAGARAPGAASLGLTRLPQEPLAVPPVLIGAGDLVVLVSLTDAALSVAQTFIVRAGDGALRAGGRLAAPQLDRVDDSRTALAARARGVERGHAVFVAFGLLRAGTDPGDLNAALTATVATLAALRADQIWVVADAGRKTDDTRRWIQAVAASVTLAGIVGIGRELTLTPDTLDVLGLPVQWESPAAAPAPLTRRQARGYPSGIDAAG